MPPEVFGNLRQLFMLICCVSKMVTTCSQMTGHLFDTMIVTKTGYNETA